MADLVNISIPNAFATAALGYGVMHPIDERDEIEHGQSGSVVDVGGIIAGALLLAVASVVSAPDLTGGLGSNGVTNAGGVWGAALVEVIATFLFVLVVLGTTDSKVGAGNFAGLAIGLSLILVHLVCINLTGTSVNPARSLGPAIFAGGAALKDVWVFICAPLAGAVLSALCWKGLAPKE